MELGSIRVVATAIGVVMGLLGPGLYAYMVNRYSNAVILWRRLRLLLLYSGAGLLLLSIGVGWMDVSTLITAVAVLVAVFLLVHLVLERRSSSLVVGLGDEVVEARLLRGQGAAAFSFTGTGRIYVSEGLIYVLEPGELAAIVAHEKGHSVALRPLSPPLVNSLLALLSVAIAMGVVSLVASGSAAGIGLGLLASLGAWGLWVTYNWAWESLADIYSLVKTGAIAYTALQRITGAVPRPLSIRDAYYDFIRSMRPRRIRGGVFLVNPHPRPETRLYIMQRLLRELYQS